MRGQIIRRFDPRLSRGVAGGVYGDSHRPVFDGETGAEQHARMLPNDFEWRPYLDGAALWLNGYMVAGICPAREGPDVPWRIVMNPRHVDMRYEFRPDEQAARRYVEAWAGKWAAQLRERYG